MNRCIKLVILLVVLPMVHLCGQEEKQYSLGISAGMGYSPFLGTMPKTLKSPIGGTMSLDHYRGKWAYYLSISGVTTNTKYNIQINDADVWAKNSDNSIFSYGISTGYSIVDRGRFRITPFAGLSLTQSKPKSSDVKNTPALKKYNVGPTFSPMLGLNLRFHFKNTDSPNYQKSKYEIDTRLSLHARIVYVPWAIRNKTLPFKGDMCYISVGVSLDMFSYGY